MARVLLDDAVTVGLARAIPIDLALELTAAVARITCSGRSPIRSGSGKVLNQDWQHGRGYPNTLTAPAVRRDGPGRASPAPAYLGLAYSAICSEKSIAT